MIMNKHDMNTYFREVVAKLTSDERKRYMISSVRNFLNYIYQEDEVIDFYRKKNLTKIKLVENREKLYNYLKLIDNGDLREKKKEDIFRDYIEEIGIFMSIYFNFKLYSGYGKYFSLVFYFILVFVLDVLINYFFRIRTFYFFASLGFLFTLLKIIKSCNSGKTYGN